jgi:hypothetical protein
MVDKFVFTRTRPTVATDSNKLSNDFICCARDIRPKVSTLLAVSSVSEHVTEGIIVLHAKLHQPDVDAVNRRL